MIGNYTVVASRIRKEIAELERVVNRIERGLKASQGHAADQDLYLDSVALNLHDFYAGLERLFGQIANNIDESIPSGRDWHRELLHQMSLSLPSVRPAVLSPEGVQQIEEYLRFRHVVRNIYAFEFDPLRLERLATEVKSAFDVVQFDLIAFVEYLEDIAAE
ncbi:MAG: hypothetical protein GY759_15250 [Chloroflexi bacterium]|nr:hypothetical protein [Chloroflexota bacterium]